jgi:hypothetical protein
MELPALKPTERDLAVTVANIRQGESATPRCEPPGEADIDIATAWVARVLKAQALYAARNTRTTPAPDPDIGGLVVAWRWRLEGMWKPGEFSYGPSEPMSERPSGWTIEPLVPASALTAMAGELREARAENDRHLKDKSDWATKWEAEHNSTLDQQARAAELTAEVERVREKLLLSDVTLQFVSVALGGPDEWSTHETMISSVRRIAEAAKAEVERLKSCLENAISARSRWMQEATKLAGRVRSLEAAAESHSKLEAEGYKALHYSEEMAEIDRLKLDVERLTKERDDAIKALDLSASARDALMVERDELIVEKSQSSWGEFQRQSKMLKEAQSEVERLTRQLVDVNERHHAKIVEAVERANEVKRLKGALTEIWSVGDGYHPNSKEKPAGTTGEGHSMCRWIAHDALKEDTSNV